MRLAVLIPERVLLNVGVVRRIWVGRIKHAVWICDVRNESSTVGGNVFVDRLKGGIVGKDVVPGGVFNLHADVLPYFDRDGALTELAINAAN